eukprot:4175023-Amphidinium_carterae.1
MHRWNRPDAHPLFHLALLRPDTGSLVRAEHGWQPSVQQMSLMQTCVATMPKDLPELEREVASLTTFSNDALKHCSPTFSEQCLAPTTSVTQRAALQNQT